jgi:aspartyl-tRNA(Asn)/glutamyl-tRNA(Gln) amidotransferase subunit A
MCVPCGFNSNHLPTALQLVGKPFDEPTVIKAAYTYQQHAKHYEQRPSI